MFSQVIAAQRPMPSVKRRRSELKKITKSLRRMAKEERERYNVLMREHRKMFSRSNDDEKDDVKVPEVVDIDTYFSE